MQKLTIYELFAFHLFKLKMTQQKLQIYVEITNFAFFAGFFFIIVIFLAFIINIQFFVDNFLFGFIFLLFHLLLVRFFYFIEDGQKFLWFGYFPELNSFLWYLKEQFQSICKRVPFESMSRLYYEWNWICCFPYYCTSSSCELFWCDLTCNCIKWSASCIADPFATSLY